jgi:hypothetical protein
MNKTVINKDRTLITLKNITARRSTRSGKQGTDMDDAGYKDGV